MAISDHTHSPKNHAECEAATHIGGGSVLISSGNRTARNTIDWQCSPAALAVCNL